MKLEKVYSTLIRLCWVTIFSCQILKLFGYRGFEIPEYLIDIPDIVECIINYCFYCLNGFCFALLFAKRKLSAKEIIIVLVVNTVLFFMGTEQLNVYRLILEIIANICLAVYLIKSKIYKAIIEGLFVTIMVILYQLCTMYYKGVVFHNLVTYLILDIDFYILIFLTLLYAFKKGGYLYVSFLNWGWKWASFLVLLPKRKCFKECLQQDQESIQEVDEIGYKVFLVLLSLAQLFAVGTLCYFINRVTIEYIIIVLSFFAIRPILGESYHANTVLKCTTLAMLVFTTATRLPLPTYVSIFCCVLIGLLVAYLMHIMYYYAKYTTIEGITIHRGMSKDTLLDLCKLRKLDELETNVLTMFYCDRWKLPRIAMKLKYSESSISRIKERALKKIRN